MANAKSLISNAAISVVQTIVSGLVLFLLYRYLLVSLGAEQLGLWSVILASTSVARLTDFGLTGGVVKFVARYRALKDNHQAAEVIQTAVLAVAGVMGALVLVVYPLLDNVLAFAVPLESMPQAVAILPWAVLSLWLGSLTGVFQSGLDGCQRMDIRNMLSIFGNVLFLLAAYALVPQYGLQGLAAAQAAQGLLLAIANWIMLRRQLTILPWLPHQWSQTKLKEMFGYAANFQINSIALLLFEPVTKLLMSRYGGLSSAAYYEMANQMVIKLRAVLIAANQVWVPAVAEIHETAPKEVRALYLKAYGMMFFITVPFFGTILVSLPVVSEIWLGYSEPQFLLFGALLTIGWGINSFSAPAYFFNQGTGALTWNSISHVAMAIVNLVLGFTLGSNFGGIGVCVGTATALLLGSWGLLYATKRSYALPYSSYIPSEHYYILALVLLNIIFAAFIQSLGSEKIDVLAASLLNIFALTATCGAAIWYHPYRKLLFERFRRTL